ncbi:A-kinase anchor protein 5 [Cavia porcellus]|uniref:A-kinase anchor protein 5 n=1 Tax=Cavia porcellus TaxID=10141 RepID=UPI000184E8E9|nr:A-kinase anchor protein 5 [Cavia porcellus]
MEATVSEIQVENKDEKRSAEVSPRDERQKKKTSMLCFKRRKKTAKVLKSKAGAEAAAVVSKGPLKAGASDQPQRPGGAWASIKGLVTVRKRSDPSKQPKPLEAEVQPEIKADLPKKKAKSRLKIPCIKFSRGAQKNNHSKITEDSGCNLKVQGEDQALGIQTQTQPNDQATKPKSTQDPNEGILQKDGNEFFESNVSNSIMPAENVISVELELDGGHSAIQTGTSALEKETEMIEKQSVQSQQAGTEPFESSETVDQQLEASEAIPSPTTPDQQTLEKSSNSTLRGDANWKDRESRETVAEEENKLKDTELSQEPALKENEINVEKPKSEESKRMEPIAIIITDTEVSEFDVKKSKNVPKQFLISVEHEQVGYFANNSDFAGRTSEQYETLLIETASSLVKNAIQLSIEQLVNEMASDDNKLSSTVT